jgi:hypothetical protein
LLARRSPRLLRSLLLPAFAATTLTLGAPTNALGASDSALRATYCIPVLKAQISQFRRTWAEAAGLQASVPAKIWQDAQNRTAQLDKVLTNNLARLQAYVASNGLLDMDLNDSTAFLVAARRGEVDAAQCEAEQISNIICGAKCGSTECPPGDVSCVQKCLANCGMATCVRTAVCTNPTWLPY